MELSKIIAHRGLSSMAPENTYSAFAAAKAAGACWLESDVSVLGDGCAVISHDYHLGRCHQIKSGTLADYNSKTYTQIDAGSWFAPQFVGERLPLLSELLGWVYNWGIGLNLELKVQNDNLVIWNSLVEAVVAELQRQQFPSKQLILSSFTLPLLYRLRELLPELRLGYLLATPDPNWEQQAEQLQLFSLNVHHSLVSQQLLNRSKSLGLKLLVYTVNEADHAQRLFDMGVDAIFSAYCQQLIEIFPY